MVNIGFDWIQTSTISLGISNFRKMKNKIDNKLSISVTSIFHAIKVEKQLINHDILTHCLTCNFRHRSQ